MSDDNNISGSINKLKPIHFVCMAAAACFALFTVIVFKSETRKKDDMEVQKATLAANSTASKGAAWTPPPDPKPEKPTLAASNDAFKKPDSAPQPQQNLAAKSGNSLAVIKPSKAPDMRLLGSRSPPQARATTEQTNNGKLSNDSSKGPTAVSAEAGSLAARLKPTALDGYAATRIKNPWAVIEEGRVIACNSVTRMTSDLPGLVKAKITHNVMSMDGTTVLIDQYSTIIGEIAQGQMQNGSQRLFVLWREVTTPKPNYVRIKLNSGAADELGQSGLDGEVNHHTWQRIKGAVMLSGIEVVTQGLSSGLSGLLSGGNKQQVGGNGLNFYQFGNQSSNLASQMLNNQINIPDTLTRRESSYCSIFTSGDLDFSSVYELKINRSGR